MMKSGYNFVHATTAQLSWHVQNHKLIYMIIRVCINAKNLHFLCKSDRWDTRNKNNNNSRNNNNKKTTVVISSIIVFQCIPYGSRTPFLKCLTLTLDNYFSSKPVESNTNFHKIWGNKLINLLIHVAQITPVNL